MGEVLIPVEDKARGEEGHECGGYLGASPIEEHAFPLQYEGVLVTLPVCYHHVPTMTLHDRHGGTIHEVDTSEIIGFLEVMCGCEPNKTHGFCMRLNSMPHKYHKLCVRTYLTQDGAEVDTYFVNPLPSIRTTI